mmetsp:Transcript_22083/g.56716  ORF Transcript_22083/g.56716 Transcript_22083/m.56716 type:complete len:268 (-) Transcript_22083:10-813(-)
MNGRRRPYRERVESLTQPIRGSVSTSNERASAMKKVSTERCAPNSLKKAIACTFISIVTDSLENSGIAYASLTRQKSRGAGARGTRPSPFAPARPCDERAESSATVWCGYDRSRARTASYTARKPGTAEPPARSISEALVSPPLARACTSSADFVDVDALGGAGSMGGTGGGGTDGGAGHAPFPTAAPAAAALASPPLPGAAGAASAGALDERLASASANACSAKAVAPGRADRRSAEGVPSSPPSPCSASDTPRRITSVRRSCEQG